MYPPQIWPFCDACLDLAHRIFSAFIPKLYLSRLNCSMREYSKANANSAYSCDMDWYKF